MPLNEALSWLGSPPRSPDQLNRIHESDSELIRLPGREGGQILASTIDSVSEEIAMGLYQDPYTMGWVTAQASLSDLAAVGARPLGVLFSSNWSPRTSVEFKTSVVQGLNEALLESKVALLGGDTGSAGSTVLSSVGLGISPLERPVSRIGIRSGDYLCLTGSVGRGPALAMRFLRGEPLEAIAEQNFRPQARLLEGQILAGIASAMMDTSDGVLTTLKTLQEVNGVGLEIEWNESTLDPLAVQYCISRDIPLWMLWVAEHGDFELVVAVSPEQWSHAQRLCPSLKRIGRAVPQEKGTSAVFRSQEATPGEGELALRERKLDLDKTQLLGYGDRPLSLQELSNSLHELINSLREEGFP